MSAGDVVSAHAAVDMAVEPLRESVAPGEPHAHARADRAEVARCWWEIERQPEGGSLKALIAEHKGAASAFA